MLVPEAVDPLQTQRLANEIVRGEMAGQPVSIVVKEDKEIPSEPRVSFQDKGINIYADSWRVGREA